MSTTQERDLEKAKDAGDPAIRFSNRQIHVGQMTVGPVLFLAAERARLNALEWTAFRVKRLGATVGAELHDIDITKPLAPSVLAEVKQALAEYKVIFFRDQPLSADQHIAFAAQFGELELHPFLPGTDGKPELVRFAKSAEVGGYENAWHHDVTWREIPSLGAVLHALQVPETGGDTLFCDMHAAYDGLSEEIKAQIENLEAEHDFMPSFGVRLTKEKQAEMRLQYPVMHHPVAPRHPVTGRRYLYVNPFFVTRIVGLSVQESEDLIAHLTRQSTYLEYQCRFQWQKDSVAFWDNHAVQHYAASDYYPDIRIMERASIIGHRPTK